MRRVVVDAHDPDAAAINEVAVTIRAGGIVAVPTDTLYGLAVDPFRADSVAKVFAVKGRSAARGLPLIAADIEQVIECIGRLSPVAERLATRFWPGPLALVLTAPDTLAGTVTGGTGTVAIRVPAHPVARALCRAHAAPLTATSANLSGEAPTASPDEVERRLGGKIDLLVDAGFTAGGPPSTIVDVTGPVPRQVRPGAIAWPDIEACLRGA